MRGAKKKGRVERGLWGTFTTRLVSLKNYCGVVGLGVVGFGAAGLGAAGLVAGAPVAAGAGIPDCVL